MRPGTLTHTHTHTHRPVQSATAGSRYVALGRGWEWEKDGGGVNRVQSERSSLQDSGVTSVLAR